METSYRQSKRLQEISEHVKKHGTARTFSDVWEAGGEGRLFTSDPAKMPERVTTPGRQWGTEPLRATTVPLSVEDTGFLAAHNLEAREAEAAKNAPPHEYLRPLAGDEMDHRRFPDLRKEFPTEEAWYAWCADKTPEQVARALQILHDQEQARVQVQELSRRVPTWQQDLGAVIEFAKRNGASEAELRAWFRNPNADQFEAMWERWKAAEREGVRERHRRHPRDLEAAGERLEAALPPQPSAPTRTRKLTPAERAALVDEVRELGVSAPKAWSEASVEKAGELFTKLIDTDE